MRDKRTVTGRSKAYDELVIEFRKLLDPTFVEPPKRETKAERKEKKDKERREQRERDIEAGLISRDAPMPDDEDANGAPKKKKKSSKKKGAAGAGGSGAGGSGAGGSGANGAAGEDGRGGEDDEPEDLDSEAEADALIDAVQRARGIPMRPTPYPPSSLLPTSPTTSTAPNAAASSSLAANLAAAFGPSPGLTRPNIQPLGVPLALPVGASSFFVARNETLRACVDLVRSALNNGSGGGGGGPSNTNNASSAGNGINGMSVKYA